MTDVMIVLPLVATALAMNAHAARLADRQGHRRARQEAAWRALILEAGGQEPHSLSPASNDPRQAQQGMA